MTNIIACDEVENIEKPNILCSQCNKLYNIICIYHTCNPLAKCGTKKKRFIDRYVNDADNNIPLDLSDQCIANCDLCIEKLKKMTSPRKGICPKCKYSGFYIFSDDDKRCQVCILEDQKISVKKETKIINPPAAAKTRLILTVDVNINGGRDPSTGKIYCMTVLGYTEDSITTEKWYITEWKMGDSAFYLTIDYTTEMKKLDEYLKKIDLLYDIVWKIQSTEAKLWLKYMYNKFGPADKHPLGEIAI